MLIFNQDFLRGFLDKFSEENIINLHYKKQVIESFVEELKVGKLDALKEESIKSRFVTEIFGNVLEYSYSNGGRWKLHEEVKSIVDGTKVDAALGFCYMEDGKIKTDVRIVIEIKNSTTSLNEIQEDRKQKISPVDQAFLYASKTEGNCRWVVVSNLVEIRFYHYSTQSCYQSYTLESLQDENILKEMLYLFKADHLINSISVSRTEKLYNKTKNKNTPGGNNKKTHVLEEMYQAIKKFDGINFINPDFLCTLRPFNILNQHVWNYNYGRLTTLNPEIYHLLKGVSITDHKVSVSKEIKLDLEKIKIVNAQEKLEFIFTRLNECLIFEILAVQDYQQTERKNKDTIGYSILHGEIFKEESGLILDIEMKPQDKCDCIICNYRTLDFNKLIRKVKVMNTDDFPMESAYGNYLIGTHNNGETYDLLRSIEKRYKGKDNKVLEYFITKLNLHNGYHILSSTLTERDENIKKEIRSIDLDSVIFNEIDLYADEDVRKYLILLKDDQLMYKLKQEVDEILETTKEIRDTYMMGGRQIGFSQPKRLMMVSAKLRSYTQQNYLMLDAFNNYKQLAAKIFQSYLYSYQTPNYGLKKFTEVILMDAILYINATDFQKMINTVEMIEADEEIKTAIVNNAKNLIRSYSIDGITGKFKNSLMEAQLMNYSFMEKYEELIANIFTLIVKMDIGLEDVKELSVDTIHFLTLEDFMPHYHLKSLGKFIEKHGTSYSSTQLTEVLQTAIECHKTGNCKYDELVKSVCKSWKIFHSESKLDDQRLMRRAIAISYNSGTAEYRRLIPLWDISSKNLKQDLFEEFDRTLSANFCTDLYSELLNRKIISYDYKDYFDQYIKVSNRMRPRNGYYEVNGWKTKELITINIAIILRSHNIDPNCDSIKRMEELTPYQAWLLNPKAFDYSKFESNWLIDADHPLILQELKPINEIKLKVDSALKQNYNPRLAEIYFKYLQ